MFLEPYQAVYIINLEQYTGLIFLFFHFYPALVYMSVRKGRALWIPWKIKQYQNGCSSLFKSMEGEVCNYNLFEIKIINLVMY